MCFVLRDIIKHCSVRRFGNVSYISLAFNATLTVLTIIKIDETLTQVDSSTYQAA